MRKKFFFATMLALTLIAMPAGVNAQQAAIPKNLVRSLDNKWLPAPGFEWLTQNSNDLRVRWVPGLRHSTEVNVIAGKNENTWYPANGFQWLNNNPNDLRVVKTNLAAGFQAPPAPVAAVNGPNEAAIGKAILKTLGAVILHENSVIQPNDGLLELIGRGLAQSARDELVDSALQDLFPGFTLVERSAVRNLTILALDGRMPRNREQILNQLRRANPGFANGTETVEFLIRLAQAIDDARRR
jgi:hypothetical protein